MTVKKGVKIYNETGLEYNNQISDKLSLFCPKGHNYNYNLTNHTCPFCHTPFKINSIKILDYKKQKIKDKSNKYNYILKTENKIINFISKQDISFDVNDSITISSLIGLNNFYNLTNHTKNISWELENYQINIKKTDIKKTNYIALRKNLELSLSFVIPFLASFIILNNYLSFTLLLIISIILSLFIQNILLIKNHTNINSEIDYDDFI